MNTHEAFMREAIRLSREYMEQGLGGPFGCVVVKDGKIVGRGWNKVTSSNDPTAHAEVSAIRDACAHLGSFQLSGCTVYTSCEPCPMCLGALYWARPDKVYYGNSKTDAAAIGFDDSFIYEELQLPLPKRSMPLEPLLAKEAKLVFDAWAEKEDKIEY